MDKKLIDTYLKIASVYSELSHAKRNKVGAAIIKNDRIISLGTNGTPAGWDNECEYKDYMSSDAGGGLNPDEIDMRWPYKEHVEKTTSEGEVWGYDAHYRLVTKDEVLHAESNAIAKVSGSTESSENATMFCTHAPCIHCAKMIWQSGIKNLYYRDTYRDNKGLEFLEKSGVNVTKYETPSQS